MFLEAMKKATSGIGENMQGFSVCFAAKKIDHPDGDNFPGVPDDQLVYTWAQGGPPVVVNMIYLELAVNLLEQFIQSNRGNLYIAMEMMKAKVLEKMMGRERQRRP